MKKILEFRLFDLLKNKDNEEFLDKVKKENPKLYTQFINILGRKGLNVAKNEYEEYDPNYVKIRKEKELEQRKRDSKEKTRQKTREYENELLLKYKPEINEVENILLKSELFKIGDYIKNNKILNAYLTQCNAKSQYKDVFSKLTNNPKILARYINARYPIEFNIDHLNYQFSIRRNSEFIKRPLINIYQLYNYSTKELRYSVYFNLSFVNKLPDMDKNKNRDFLKLRYTYVESLNNNNVDKNELYKLIDKYTTYLSDEYYENWLEDRTLKQQIEIYNI